MGGYIIVHSPWFGVGETGDGTNKKTRNWDTAVLFLPEDPRILVGMELRTARFNYMCHLLINSRSELQPVTPKVHQECYLIWMTYSQNIIVAGTGHWRETLPHEWGKHNPDAPQRLYLGLKPTGYLHWTCQCRPDWVWQYCALTGLLLVPFCPSCAETLEQQIEQRTSRCYAATGPAGSKRNQWILSRRICAPHMPRCSHKTSKDNILRDLTQPVKFSPNVSPNDQIIFRRRVRTCKSLLWWNKYPLFLAYPLEIRVRFTQTNKRCSVENEWKYSFGLWKRQPKIFCSTILPAWKKRSSADTHQYNSPEVNGHITWFPWV